MKKLTQKLTIVLLSAFLVVLVSCDDTGSGEETKKQPIDQHALNSQTVTKQLSDCVSQTIKTAEAENESPGRELQKCFQKHYSAITSYERCWRSAEFTYKFQGRLANHKNISVYFEAAIHRCNKDFSTSYLQCSDTVVAFVGSSGRAFDNSMKVCVEKHADTITYKQCMEAATDQFRTIIASKSKKYYTNTFGGITPKRCVKILENRITKEQCEEAKEYSFLPISCDN